MSKQGEFPADWRVAGKRVLDTDRPFLLSPSLNCDDRGITLFLPNTGDLYELARTVAHRLNTWPLLVEALQALYDEQNGPPTISRSDQWADAMALANKALTAARD